MRRSFLNFSRFVRCKFIATHFEDTVFEEAIFEAVEFGDARSAAPPVIVGGKQDQAPVQRTRVLHFQGVLATFDVATRISNVEFLDAELRSARFVGTTLKNVMFATSSDDPTARSDLSGAIFDKVDLAEVGFRNVDLSGADLSSARGVTAGLLAGACGNRETRLPPGHTIKSCRAEAP